MAARHAGPCRAFSTAQPADRRARDRRARRRSRPALGLADHRAARERTGARCVRGARLDPRAARAGLPRADPRRRKAHRGAARRARGIRARRAGGAHNGRRGPATRTRMLAKSARPPLPASRKRIAPSRPPRRAAPKPRHRAIRRNKRCSPRSDTAPLLTNGSPSTVACPTTCCMARCSRWNWPAASRASLADASRGSTRRPPRPRGACYIPRHRGGPAADDIQGIPCPR